MCRYAKLSSVVELADESEPKFAKIQQAIHKITTIRERDYWYPAYFINYFLNIPLVSGAPVVFLALRKTSSSLTQTLKLYQNVTKLVF